MFDRLDALALRSNMTAQDVVMAQDDTLATLQLPMTQTWSLGETLESATEQLFAGLRFYDETPEVATIYVEKMPPIGIGKAYNNRLAKATGNQEFTI